MEFSIDEKNLMLKTFTTHIKSMKGRGPNNIYLKYYDHEIHVIIHGMMCVYEKYVLDKFGEEAKEFLKWVYDNDSQNTAEKFDHCLGNMYRFDVYELSSDFEKDVFIYKMSYKRN